MTHITPELGLAYLDGQLDGARRAKLERHLVDCPTCRAALAEQQAVYHLLVASGRNSQPRPPTIPNWRPIPSRPRPGLSLRPLLLGFAALIVVFVGWLVAGRPSPIEPPAVLHSPLITPSPSPTAPQPLVAILTPSPTAPRPDTPTALVPPRPTLTPTPEPLVAAALGLTHFDLGQQGTMAFIVDQILYLHDPAGAEPITRLAWPVSQMVWSPDGSQLLYQTNNGDCVPAGCAWYVWQRATQTTIPLTYLVPDFGPGNWHSPLWTADGKKIFLLNGDSGDVALADIGQQQFTGRWLHLPNLEGIWQIEPNTLLVGAAGRVFLYDLAAQQLQEWPGRLLLADPTMHLLAIRDGELTNFYNSRQWQLIWSGVVADLLARPDGGYIGLQLPNHSVTIVAHDGNEYGLERPNSRMLAWRPGGGPVLAQSLEDGQTQLVYWPTSGGEVARAFVLPRPWLFPAGTWSPDSQSFFYNAIDPATGAAYLYVWQPANGPPTLRYAHNGPAVMGNFVWQPDGSGFYATLDEQTLWYYDLEADLFRPVLPEE